MAKRGRKPLEQKRRRLCVYIDEDLYAQFQFTYFDPKLGRAEFGKFSQLVNLLLKEHIEKTHTGPTYYAAPPVVR